MEVLEGFVRSALDDTAPRAFAVIDPLIIRITNWPQGKVESFQTPIHPKFPEMGKRTVQMSGTVVIDKCDWRDEDEAK